MAEKAFKRTSLKIMGYPRVKPQIRTIVRVIGANGRIMAVMDNVERYGLVLGKSNYFYCDVPHLSCDFHRFEAYERKKNPRGDRQFINLYMDAKTRFKRPKA